MQPIPSGRFFMSLLLLLLSASVSQPNLNADEVTPYAAFTIEDGTKVHSGPDAQFYVTTELSWGARVTVYRHDGDYAAIRPPQSSFSWVPAAAIEVDPQQTTARVTQSDVKTRIGSETTDRFDAEYVTLRPDERLQVLGFQTIDDVEWVKVAPPSGEFRWIHREMLQKTPPVKSDLQQEPSEQEQPDQQPESSDEAALAEAQEVLKTTTPQDTETQEDVVQLEAESNHSLSETPHENDVAPDPDHVELAIESVTVHDTPAETGSPGGESALAQWSYELAPKQLPPREDKEEFTSANADAHQIQYLTTEMSPSEMTLEETPFGFSEVSRQEPMRSVGPTSPEYLALQLDQLEVAVSRQVCKPPAEWQLSGIHGSCMAVIDAAEDVEIRQRAQVLLAKVAQFEDVRRRGLRLSPSLPVDGPTEFAGVDPNQLPPPASPSPLYDGSGWLMPVLTNRQDVPRYVLTNDQGQVLQFVSPQPGLNLGRYERKKVGIFGQRGYLPSMSQPHLMAERIVSLDKVR